MLEVECKTISPNKFLHVIDLKEISSGIKDLLDKFFVSICEGDSDSDLKLVKKRLIAFLESKQEDTQMGAVAEFLIHLYLNYTSFKQEFLFFNLEENSIKKGFDGVFSKDSQTYLVESKSGSILSKGISHKNKLRTAYSDLAKYVSGQSEKGKNNPWKNAYNHASHCDVATEKGIRKKIKKLKDMYDLEQYTEITDYNIIPCSTIYLDSEWQDELKEKIIGDTQFFDNFDSVSVNAICITKSSLQNFMLYLGE